MHGKNVEITLDGDDLTDWSDTCESTDTADIHDTTTYGSAQTSNAHAQKGGLLNGEFSIGGLYETGATGPRGIIKPLRGQNVVFTYKPEGTGATKPLDTATVVVGEYKETAPVADYIRWTCKLTVDGAVATTAQGA